MEKNFWDYYEHLSWDAPMEAQDEAVKALISITSANADSLTYMMRTIVEDKSY